MLENSTNSGTARPIGMYLKWFWALLATGVLTLWDFKRKPPSPAAFVWDERSSSHNFCIWKLPCSPKCSHDICQYTCHFKNMNKKGLCRGKTRASQQAPCVLYRPSEIPASQSHLIWSLSFWVCWDPVGSNHLVFAKGHQMFISSSMLSPGMEPFQPCTEQIPH